MERLSQLLARIARVDEALLHPVEHGDEKQQRDMPAINLRDALVRARVGLINAVRFTLKSPGYTVADPASERFHKTVREDVPLRPDGSVSAPAPAKLKEAGLAGPH